MASRFSSVVDECEVCTATTTSSPCDTCTGYGNQTIEECRRCRTTLHAGWAKLSEIHRVDYTGDLLGTIYVWTCKDFRACYARGW